MHWNQSLLFTTKPHSPLCGFPRLLHISGSVQWQHVAPGIPHCTKRGGSGAWKLSPPVLLSKSRNRAVSPERKCSLQGSVICWNGDHTCLPSISQWPNSIYLVVVSSHWWYAICHLTGTKTTNIYQSKNNNKAVHVLKSYWKARD